MRFGEIRRGIVTVSEKATVEVFWKAIETLKPAERMALAERILHDRRLLDDMYDHALIERAKGVKGRSMTLDEYLVRRKKRRA
jgi:hypothetical protein